MESALSEGNVYSQRSLVSDNLQHQMRSMHNWEGDKAQGKGSEAVNGKSSAVLLAANMVAKREHRTFSICIAISICAPSRWSTFDYFIFFFISNNVFIL